MWSFGVFLAELLSHDCDPYPKMKAIGDVKTFVLEKKKMVKPDECPKDVYSVVMKECFHYQLTR